MLFIVIITSLFLRTFCDVNDGGKAPRITLNDGHTMPTLGLDGHTMPTLGLGTFVGFDKSGITLRPPYEKEIVKSVNWALNAGYRLIDTASLYMTEEQVGEAVRSSSVSRGDIFVITKLNPAEMQDVLGSLKRALARLNMSYVDLYLIHFPISLHADKSTYDLIDYVETWKHMEEAKRLGLARSIGLSNFNVSQIERVMANCEIKPAALEIEVNLNMGQSELISYCQENKMSVIAYTPLGSLYSEGPYFHSTGPISMPGPRATDPVLQNIAEGRNKTVPQVVLRYLVQKGVIPIPKSVQKVRIQENIDIFDFELTKKDMELLDEFNINFRRVVPGFWQDHPYYPFEKTDQKFVVRW